MITIVNMMSKFGLIVRVRSDAEDERLKVLFSAQDDEENDKGGKGSSGTHGAAVDAPAAPVIEDGYLYLVPALLPDAPETTHQSSASSDGMTPEVLDFLSESIWANDPSLKMPVHTVYFAFTISTKVGKGILTVDDMRTRGFLPNGLFERMIGRAVAWSQQTNPNGLSLDTTPLYRDSAILNFGVQRFRLTLSLELNSIRVDVLGRSPTVVVDRLFDHIKKVTTECMHSLQVFMCVAYPMLPASNRHTQVASVGSASQVTFVPVELLRKVAEEHMELNRPDGRRLLSYDMLTNIFEVWLPEKTKLKDVYDVFISYRWNAHDSAFTSALFDTFSYFAVGPDSRPPIIFLDRKRLEDGRNYKSDFVVSLLNTSLVVPIVSYDALLRLMTHDCDHEDNLLIEWICVLECIRLSGKGLLSTRIERIYPIMFGKRDVETGRMQSLFRSGDLNKISTKAPTASLKKASILLRDSEVFVHGIVGKGINKDTFEVQTYTVKEIVDGLLSYQGFSAWNAKYTNLQDAAMLEGAKLVIKVLQTCSGPNESLVSESIPTKSSGPPHRHVNTAKNAEGEKKENIETGKHSLTPPIGAPLGGDAGSPTSIAVESPPQKYVPPPKDEVKNWLISLKITPQSAVKYAKLFEENNIGSVDRLVKRYRKKPSLLEDLGVDEFDAEDVVKAISHI